MATDAAEPVSVLVDPLGNKLHLTGGEVRSGPAGGPVRLVVDAHLDGRCPRAVEIDWFADAGGQRSGWTKEHQLDPGRQQIGIALWPAQAAQKLPEGREATIYAKPAGSLRRLPALEVGTLTLATDD